MNIISAEEWELLSLFEVEPELPEGEPWPYTTAIFDVQQGDVALVFAIQPAYRDVGITLTVAGHEIYSLKALQVRDVRYVNECGIETLRVIVNDTETLVLRVKPQITIHHEIQMDE